jgi:hypothetical protein
MKTSACNYFSPCWFAGGTMYLCGSKEQARADLAAKVEHHASTLWFESNTQAPVFHFLEQQPEAVQKFLK